MMSMKRTGCVVVLLCWIVCGVTLKLIGPGAFEGLGAMYSVGTTYDRYDKLLEKVLDFATAPLQLVFWGVNYVYENSDGRVREKKEQLETYERERAERQRYLSMLDEDGERMFTEPEFLNPTNRVAVETLNGWILAKQRDRTWCKQFLPRCAEHVMAHPEIMPAIDAIWRFHNLSLDMQRRGMRTVVRMAEDAPQPSRDIEILLGNIIGEPEDGSVAGVIPVDEIIPYVDHPNEMVSRCAERELSSRRHCPHCASLFPKGWSERHK